ncbi:aminotransferase class III-fold pyridoxal phosphate-dependent enzyme [Paraburkholderia sediminicola]|uniref:aminotransferase class III-fold pyridoxal phosphate-dependent enzyme n=2 Tax=Paraburkholderia sediminicola TaxID=458836 RepID=UPI0038BB14F6
MRNAAQNWCRTGRFASFGCVPRRNEARVSASGRRRCMAAAPLCMGRAVPTRKSTHARRHDMNERAGVKPPDMSAFWMPFTANRQFKSAPRLLASAKGMYYTSHDASTIAVVIVEPVAGSTGVLILPQGYLQRLREICDKHGILLIFDEVITDWGRLGAPFAAQYFGVTPDMLTMAKGTNNAAAPMGAVAASAKIHDSIVNGAPGGIELFHGYTYSGHPIAAAAACATIDLYERDQLFERAARMAPVFEKAIHKLQGERHVIDVRNLGLVGGVELAPRSGAPGARAYDVFVRCYEKGVLTRYTGDILAFSPPLIVEEAQLEEIFGTVAEVLREVE